MRYGVIQLAGLALPILEPTALMLLQPPNEIVKALQISAAKAADLGPK